VIVIGFRPLASPALKTEPAAARSSRGLFAKRAERRPVVVVVAAHAAGSGNLSSIPARRHLQLLDTMARPATTNTALLPRRHLWRNEANVVNARLMTDVEYISHGGKVQSWVPFDEHDLLGAGGENTFQLI
jgi:hypothetical protein